MLISGPKKLDKFLLIITFNKIKKTGSSTMNESLRLKLENEKAQKLRTECLTDHHQSLSPKPMKL